MHVDRKRVVFDRGMVLPGTGQEPVIAAHHPALVIDTRSKLEAFPLRDVRNDTRSRPYCGPTAIAAITGAPISMVRDAYRLVRFGGEWIYRPRAPAIIGTTYAEAEKVLRLLGFVGVWHRIDGAPTFAAYMQMRKGMQRTNASILFVTGHAVAVSGWQFCDTLSKGMVIEADDARGRRKRVREVFVITGRVPPATHIPRKVCLGARNGARRSATPARPTSGLSSRSTPAKGPTTTGPRQTWSPSLRKWV